MAKCTICGQKGLEVIEVCPECMKKANIDPKHIKRLRNMSNILSITADTDGNIKECMQGLIEIADELEGGIIGKEEKKESNIIQTGTKDGNIQ